MNTLTPLLDRAAHALRQRAEISEFVARERRGATAELVRDASGLRTSMSLSHAVEVELFRDRRQGRGSDRFELAASEFWQLEDAVTAAILRAEAELGPSWTLAAPSAPARVEVADPEVTETELEHLLFKALKAIDREASAAELHWAWIGLRLERRVVSVATNTGFATSYVETTWAIDGAVQPVERADAPVEAIRLTERRFVDFDLRGALAAAAQRARMRPRATALSRAADGETLESPTPPGLFYVDLLVPAALLTHHTAHGLHGWLSGLVAQADSASQRRGTSRYLRGQPLLPGATRQRSELTITSDGSLPFGLYSAPCGPSGEAVRRFIMVDRGVAGEPGLDMRAGQLSLQAPNGGVRNLVVSPGSETEQALRTVGDRPLLELFDLRWAQLAPLSGMLSIGLGLSEEITTTSRRVLEGGSLSADSIALWAKARLANTTVHQAWYAGPTWVRFDNLPIR